MKPLPKRWSEDIQEEGGRALALRVDGGMFIVQDPWRTREFADKNRSST